MSKNKDCWENLDGKREFKKINDGNVILVAPVGQRQHVVPLFCPLCECPMKTQEDAEVYLKNRLCSHCLKEWGEINPIDYKSEKWKEYKEKREILATPIINIV
jgi:hypothetical protein